MTRIVRVETIPYALPFKRPYVSARGELGRREIVLLRLHTESGLVGLGEAVPLSLRRGERLERVERRLSDAAIRLVGLDLGPEGHSPLQIAIATVLELTHSRRLPSPAAAALESALFDLAARIEGVPLWRALGAGAASPVACNATLVAGSPAAVAADARAWADEGFETFKLKLGTGDDVACVEAVRAELGPAARIRVDANEAWSAREAINLLRSIEPLDIELAEQPVRGLRAMARVARATAIPLAADEAVASEADAHRAARRRACAFATIKLSKVGGIGAGRTISSVVPGYLSSALDGPVGIAAAAHGAQVLDPDGPDAGPAHGLATQRLFAATIASTECSLRDGALIAPDGPGLGVELDEPALDRHRL